MKRILFTSLVSAAVALQPALAAAALTQIGAAAAVRGMPRAQSQGEPAGRLVESGKPIFQNDHVATDANSKMQVLLKDETVFTLGPNSDMVLDEFVYDPESPSLNRVTATVTKGVFRFVTGKIAGNQPSSMKVKLPVGTIGIRGTIVAGIVTPTMCAAMLAGPGAGNNANAKAGAFELSNGMGSSNVTVPGEGSMITGSGAPTPPGPLPASVVGDINTGLASAPTGDSDDGGSGSASEESGDTNAAGQESAGETAATTEVAQELDSTATQGSQDNTRLGAGVADGISTYEQMRTVSSGNAFFFSNEVAINCSGCPASALAPVGAVQIYVDFTNRSLGGVAPMIGPSGQAASFIHLHGVYVADRGDTVQQDIGQIAYSLLSGNATINSSNFIGGATGGQPGDTFSGTTIDIINKGGVVGAEAVGHLQFSNSSTGRSATGDIVAPRQDVTSSAQ